MQKVVLSFLIVFVVAGCDLDSWLGDKSQSRGDHDDGASSIESCLKSEAFFCASGTSCFLALNDPCEDRGICIPDGDGNIDADGNYCDTIVNAGPEGSITCQHEDRTGYLHYPVANMGSCHGSEPPIINYVWDEIDWANPGAGVGGAWVGACFTDKDTVIVCSDVGGCMKSANLSASESETWRINND